ncbi:hypothetical protein [Moorena producens]|uniref:hypothetical protein n=1 Tax=Moorena producens TaxID=1155739 RepID=UPI003C721260
MILRVGARLQGREGLLTALGRTCGMGIRRGTGILPVINVELASCPLSMWNWHLASFMLIFERASCPLYSYSFQD